MAYQYQKPDTEKKIELANVKYNIVEKLCRSAGIDSWVFRKYVSMDEKGNIAISLPSDGSGSLGMMDRIKYQFDLFELRRESIEKMMTDAILNSSC